MQVVFLSGHAPTHSPVISGPACNTGANLRCDDPLDLSGSSGMAAPQVQSDFALNDIEVQTRPSATASWNVLDGYQFTYAESGPATITDPATGQASPPQARSLLTQAQKFGANYGVSGTIALATQTFTYGAHDQSYVDSAYQPNPATRVARRGIRAMAVAASCGVRPMRAMTNISRGRATGRACRRPSPGRMGSTIRMASTAAVA